jgi:hypothetical protein
MVDNHPRAHCRTDFIVMDNGSPLFVLKSLASVKTITVFNHLKRTS